MGLIYLITILDSLSNFFFICMLVSLLLSGIITLVWLIEYGADEDMFKKLILKLWIAQFIFDFLYILTPNTKQAVAIFSVGSTIEYVKGNDKIKELPDKMIDYLDKYIDEYLSEEKSE